MIIQRILDLLNEKSLKMVDLCRFLGINTSTMTNWKNRGTDPPARYIPPICEFLGVSIEYLLTGEEPEIQPVISMEDREWLSLIHQLPDHARYELRGEIKGYLRRMEEESTKTREKKAQ